MYFEREPALQALLNACYERAEVLGTADAPATMTGFLVRPLVVFVPGEGNCGD